jgi:mannitol-1-phosphate 5-dehydrogenase
MTIGRRVVIVAAMKTFVGFGFGAIQGGLFLYEAFHSGRFGRFVVAEVMPEIVTAIRQAQGRYRVNVATAAGIERREVGGIEIFNPLAPAEREALAEAVAQADEIATALPSVKFYGAGEPGSVVAILAEGFRRRVARAAARRSIIYTAENHNHAAEILEEKLAGCWQGPAAELKSRVQCLNTVIGKMSGVVADEAQIAGQGLARMAGAAGRCFLVEAFNRILISRIQWPDFERGIAVFEEKDDLLPFEEAKLYGHNATHALLGYLARERGLEFMADIRADRELLALGRAAFLDESGRALCARRRGVDPLFTAAGYQDYAEDLLERMLNPHLRDSVARVTRDPRRKLGWDDRLVGTLRVVRQQRISPLRYAQGARAALRMLAETEGGRPADLLDEIWAEAKPAESEKREIKKLLMDSEH